MAQENVEPARSMFPLKKDGSLEFRDMQVDAYPQAYLGEDFELLQLAFVGGSSTSA